MKKVRIKKKHIKRFSLFFPLLLLAIGAVVFYFFILKDLPSPTKLSSYAFPQSSQIFDRNDHLMYTAYANRNQTFVPIAQIPKHLQSATIAVEDKDFYKHGAIDIRGIARAFISTVFRKQVQGGSTLTQQLVKNSLLTPERTITRKIKEVILAFATEVMYPKNKILEMYLNQSPYGGTAWGAEAAAQTYFGKHVTKLTLAESALLAGLPESPTTNSPFGAYPQRAKTRQEEILRKMQEQRYITKQEQEDAIATPLHYNKVVDSIEAPHFALYVKDLVAQKYGERRVEEGGLKIKTSLDINIQNFVQDTVASEVAKLKNYHVTNGAAVVTNPATGEILAMVGSKDYFDAEIDGNVNVTTSDRQPGSSIKPINYAVGLIKGYTAATPFIDQAICFPGGESKQYCPLNYDRKFHGVVAMRPALGNSFNIPAVKMLKLNSLEAMIATASAMGINSFKDPDRYGLSLTLGGGEVKMLDMATAFGVFANQGHRIDLHPILSVTDSKGTIVEEYKPPSSPIFGKRVIPPAVAFIISDILADNTARQQVFGANSALKIGKHIVSVKTGTTNDLKDNWAIGYTPSYLTVVWVGNNDNTPMSGVVSGVSGAAPIWHTVMEHLLENKAPEPPHKPDTVVGKVICTTSGLLPPPDGTPDRCPTKFEYFVKGFEPKQVDHGRQKVWIDKTTNDLPKKDQTENLEERSELVVTDPLGDRYCLTCPRPEPSPSPNP